MDYLFCWMEIRSNSLIKDTLGHAKQDKAGNGNNARLDRVDFLVRDSN